ncbi:MAG: YbjN domain-containing protein [Parachlamydiaceae bacterium]|nr:YbjN domain-containing protein [Parachlamydiaceae bacterium]
MINMIPADLLAYLRKNNYEADIQEETQQVYTILKISEKEYPLFLRIFDEGHLLQLLAFIPTPLPTEVVSDMARLLHLLNKELDVPGFGMDEIVGAVFYRLMLPTPKKKIDGEVLIAFIRTIEHVCKMFATPVEAVGHGQITLDDILKKINEMEAKKK